MNNFNKKLTTLITVIAIVALICAISFGVKSMFDNISSNSTPTSSNNSNSEKKPNTEKDKDKDEKPSNKEESNTTKPVTDDNKDNTNTNSNKNENTNNSNNNSNQNNNPNTNKKPSTNTKPNNGNNTTNKPNVEVNPNPNPSIEPTIPDIPVEPEIPDVPAEPDTPDTPNLPTEPENPDIPDKPSEPFEPDKPEIPDEPIIPDDPDEPDTPDTPDVPNIPDKPENPEEPNEPDVPDTPEEPEDPIGPPAPPIEPDEPDIPDEPPIIDPDTKFKGLTFPQITPTDKKVTYTEFQISNQKQVERGITGNNTQWITQFESSRDGELMLFSEDVSGMFKSTDHGLTWKRANSGITSPGVGMFAIDPYNNNHVLALGLSSRESIGSIFISNDGAESWKKSCFYEGKDKPCNGTSSNGARYQYDGLEFDPTSYDSNKNQSMVVYYSTPFLRDNELTHNKTGDGKPPIDKEEFEESETKYYKLMRLTDTASQENKKNKMGLYISTDGGNTFEMFIKDVKLSDGMIKILDNGSLYIGNEYGLFKIDKNNKTIEREYLPNTTKQTSKGITGLDSVGNTLYIQTWDGIYTLDDATQVMTKISDDATYKKNNWPRSIEVSVKNPDHMLMTYRTSVTNYYSNTLTYTLDGGKTWTDSEMDLNTTYYTANSWRSREKMIVIDPTNDQNVITTGGDYIAHSEDYGAHFIQSNGATHTMQGGKFNFNYHQPELLFLSAQDYTGNITHDGAITFSDVVIKDKQSNNLGNVYGGFAADDNTWFGFVKQTWCGGTLMITHNGGDTWEDTGLESEVHKCSFYSSLQSINNPDVLFANEFYSKDRGYTWQKMQGATSVFTYNVTGKHELYGGDSEGDIVVSYDEGDTWEKVTTITWTQDSMYDPHTGKTKYGENIIDMAYDHVNNIFYVVVMTFTNAEHSGDRTHLYKYELNTGDKTLLDVPRKDGTMRFKTVAIDPNSTSVIYIGGSGDYFSAVDSLSRSIDGGTTWRVLTTHNDPNIESWATNQGGYEISNLRVDPYTGYVLASAGCNGYFLIDPPYDTNLLNHKTPEEHTIKYMYNDEEITVKKQKNNTVHNYEYHVDGLEFIGWYLDKDLTIPYKNGEFVYNSMTLYAKMSESKKITFHEGDTIVKVLDADKYSETIDDLILKRDGYAFAGWYTDTTLTTKADLKNVTENINVYAGFYKVVSNIYKNETIRDVNSALNYNTQMTDSLGTYYTNDVKLTNRSNLLTLEKGKSYYIMMKMDNRFRLGFFEERESSYKPVEKYWIHPYDTNSKYDHLGMNVSYLLKDNDYKRLMLYYYTLNDEVNFLDVKNTIRIYELVDTTLYL